MFRLLSGCLAAGCFLLVLCGCATVRIDLHSTGAEIPLLRNNPAPDRVLVLWGAAWRSNQKEPGRREEIASAAIGEFFDGKAVVKRTVDGAPALLLSDSQIFRSKDVTSSRYERIIVLRIEELGPLLTFYLSPVLWEGSTDVSFRVRVLDPSSAALVSEIGAQWKKGGAFHLRGVSKLKEDLKSALASIFG